MTNKGSQQPEKRTPKVEDLKGKTEKVRELTESEANAVRGGSKRNSLVRKR
jgi:hypothetical protein